MKLIFYGLITHRLIYVPSVDFFTFDANENPISVKLNPISILKSDEPILNTKHICELLKYKYPKTQSSARCFQNAVNLMSLTPHHRPEQGDQTPKVSAEKFLHGEMIERKVW